MPRRLPAVVVLVSLAACSNGKASEPRITVPTAPATTTTTAVSYAVPATIDAPYIEKVMAALDHLDGEAARRAASQRKLDEEFLKYLVAIYNTKAFDLARQGWYELAGNDFKTLAPEPGDPRTIVERILSAGSDCVLFAADRSFAALFVDPDPPTPQRYIALTRLPADRDPGARNPTPWIMNFDGRFKDDHEPTSEEACAGS